MLVLKNLTVTLDTHPIIKDLSLDIAPGSLHALMGPNGSGKSSLAHVIMGHPRYAVQGSILYGDTDIITLSPDKRAQFGIFVAFQHPVALPGVSVFQFLKEAYQARGEIIEVAQFQELLNSLLASVGLDQSFAQRSVNDGFSGGEKKRLEIIQMLLLQPSLIILDEIDSGLDVDGLALVSQAITRVRMSNPSVAVIVISHYQRLFTHLRPDHVHIMYNGSLLHSGTYALVDELEQTGYQPFINRVGSERGASI